MIFLLMVASMSLHAGTDPHFKKYGKVSAEDFAPTNLDDLGYDAVVLQASRSVTFDENNRMLRFVNTYHIRLKVLKDGFQDPDFFTVKFSGRYEYEFVGSNKCSVYSLSGGKVQGKRIKFSAFTTYNRDSLNSRQVIEIPPARRGDIIDWEYSIVSFNFMWPDVWRSQMKYPCVANALISDFPVFMQYRYDLRGRDTSLIERSTNYSFISMSYDYSPKDNPQSMNYMMGKSDRRTIIYKFNSQLDTFKVFNSLPEEFLGNAGQDLYGEASVRLKPMKFIQDIGYTGPFYAAWQQLSHLIFVYAEPENRYISQNEAWFRLYNSGFVIVDSKNWERFHKRLWKSPSFWKPILKHVDTFGELADHRDPDSDLDTMRAVADALAFIRRRVRWDSTFSNSIYRDPGDVLESGNGNSAEVNMLYVSVLRQLGVDAFPVLSSTTDYSDIDTSYANMVQFNSVLAGIRLNALSADYRGTYLLIDACTQQEPNPNALPVRYLNNAAVAVEVDGCQFLDITGLTNDTYNAKKMDISD